MLRKDGTPVTRFSDVALWADVTSGDSAKLSFLKTDRPELIPVETRYETQINLLPGEYDLGLILSDGTRFGRTEIPFAVDSFDRKQLAVSQVSLCKQVSDVSAYSPQKRPRLMGTWAAKPRSYVPLVSRGIEFKPTANTRFKNGEALYTYFEAYEPLLGGESPVTVQLQIRVVDMKSGEVISAPQPVSASAYVRPGSPVIPVGRGMDISKLPPGSYRLDVQATDSAGGSTPWRSATFTVE